MVEGICAIELYMQERYIFPVAYMQVAENIQKLSEKVYDIYYILYISRR